MSGLHRRAARRDANEAKIVAALRQVGATVERLSIEDVPDLLVGFRGETYLLEVKSGHGDLRPGQIRWLTAWRGGKARPVWSVLEALQFVGAVL
jgi:hypothetical protein